MKGEGGASLSFVFVVHATLGGLVHLRHLTKVRSPAG